MKRRFKNRYDHKKPVPLFHIAKLAWFKFVLEKWDESQIPQDCFEPEGPIFQMSDDQHLEALPQGEVFINVIGHSTCLIQIGNKTILTDPVWSEIAGPFNMIGPKKAPTSLDLEDLQMT